MLLCYDLVYKLLGNNVRLATCDEFGVFAHPRKNKIIKRRGTRKFRKTAVDRGTKLNVCVWMLEGKGCISFQ